MELKRNLAAFLVHDFEMENIKKTVNSADQSHHDHNTSSEDNIMQSSSSATNERGLQDYNKIVEMEAVIVEDLVKPLIFLFKYFLPFHDTISFDSVARCCVLVKGSLFRRGLCIIWQLIVIYRLVIKAIPSLNADSPPESSKGNSLSILAKGAYFTFITFSCVVFYVYWLKTNNICGIFNDIISLSENLHVHHRSPSRIKAVKVAIHGSWLFVTSYIIFTVVLYTIQLLKPATTHETNEAAATLLNLKENRSKSVEYQLDFTEIHVSDDFILLQILTAVGSFMNIFSWMTAFLHLGAWAMVFRQLVVVFYWRISSKEEMGHYILIPQEIRTFNKISSIIDEFNGIYSLSCLLGAVVCVSYVTPTIKHAFSGLTHVPQIGSGWHLMLSYIPMIAATLMIAEINRVAGSFAGVIKNQFGKFTKECGDPAESLCGIAIVHYDLSTSNIGFKGLGFFTVSYSFVTTIVSVIISYSILVVQLFPHDNSDIEV